MKIVDDKVLCSVSLVCCHGDDFIDHGAGKATHVPHGVNWQVLVDVKKKKKGVLGNPRL